MLSIDHQRTINGITVYRDFQATDQYYYLPKDKVRIADNGKGIQFVAYIDGEVVEGTEPTFTDDLDRTGGFLTLEVELGPNDAELEQLKEKLASEVGSDVKLAQVPFKDGAVKLVMFGTTGGDANSAVNLTVAGSTKPSLIGKQTAVFSLKLGGKEAQIMWSLLKNSTQTQVGVVYDLSFYGVMPAYHLEITVDFKATEDYWQHHIDADFALQTSSLKIVSNNDIDLIMRDLVNTGAITVNIVDYTGTGQGSPLGSDDPSGMKLVKELMSPTLFDASAIPRDDYNVLGSTLPSERDGSGASTTPSQSATPTPSPSPTPSGEGETDTPIETPIVTATTPSTTSTPTNSSTTSPTGTTSASSASPTPSRTVTPPDNDGSTPTNTTTPSLTNTPRQTPTTTATPSRTPTVTATPTPTPTSTSTPTTTSTGTRTATTTGTSPTPSPTPTTENNGNTPEKVGTSISINAGYSLKHRSISQKIKRSFVFNKAEAKLHDYHPSGALTTAGTAFDKDLQVMLVRLGDGPFKEIEIEIRSALNFAEFNIREAIVHISYGFGKTNGDKSHRKHEVSIMVNQEAPRKFINFFVDDFGTMDYDYTVEFIHEAGSIIGSHETKIKSRLFENVVERDIAINIDDHSPLIPVEIQLGHIHFSDDAVQAAHVFVAPKKDVNGRTVIFKEGESETKKFLIFPTIANQYVYFKKEKFFFKEDAIEEEFDGLTDSQVIVNRPETRVLTIAPQLVDSNQLVKKAIVKVKYENGAGEELVRSIVLKAQEAEGDVKSFSIIVEEEDPRIWNATTQFLLSNGEIIEGKEQEYKIEEPFISLESCGLRVLKVSTMLQAETFGGNIAAVQVQIFDSAGTALETIMLRSSKIEEAVVLKDVTQDEALTAVVTVFHKDGSEENINIVVPGGSPELLLRIFNV